MEGLQKRWKIAKTNNCKEQFIGSLLKTAYDKYKNKFSEDNSLSILKILNDYVSNLPKNPSRNIDNMRDWEIKIPENTEKAEDLRLLYQIADYAIQFDHLNILKIINTHISLGWLQMDGFVKSKHEIVVQSVLTSIHPKDWKFFHIIKSLIISAMTQTHELLVCNTLKQYITYEFMSNSYDLRFELGCYPPTFILDIIISAVMVKSPVFELLFNDNVKYCKPYASKLISKSLKNSNSVSLSIVLNQFPEKWLNNILDYTRNCVISKEIIDVLITYFSKNSKMPEILGLLIKYVINAYIHAIDKSNDKYRRKHLGTNIIYESILYLLSLPNNTVLSENMQIELFNCLISEKNFKNFQGIFNILKPSLLFIKGLTKRLLTMTTGCIFLDYNKSCLDCDDCDYDGMYSRANYDRCNENHSVWREDESFEFFSELLAFLVTNYGDDIQNIIQQYLPDVINFHIYNEERVFDLISVVNLDKDLVFNTFRNLAKIGCYYPYYAHELDFNEVENIDIRRKTGHNTDICNVLLVHEFMLVTIKLNNIGIFGGNLTSNSFFNQIYCINEFSEKYRGKMREFYFSDKIYQEAKLKESWIKIALTKYLPNDILNIIVKLL